MPADADPARPLLRRAGPALSAFVGIRLLGVVALWGWSVLFGGPRKAPHILLSLRWDSLWYSRIARDGYGYSVRTRGGDLHSDLAFFPLMPTLERIGHAITGLPVSDVGLIISGIASLGAAAGIFAVTELVTTAGAAEGMVNRPASRARPGTGTRTTRGWLTAPTLAVILWAALPVGIVEWMAYSESLFTALAAWSLYCVLSRRWVVAGFLASAVGLTRPVGLGVVLAVWVGATVVVHAAMSRRRTSPDTVSTRACWIRLGVGVLLAPLGMVSYVLWVAHRTGRGIAGYLDVQAGWRNGFDGGLTFARFIAAKFTSPAGAAAGLGLLAGVALAGWGVAACFRYRRHEAGEGEGNGLGERGREGLPVPVLTYVVVLVALALGAKGYFGSKPRFFVPIFPLLIPPAAWLAGRAAVSSSTQAAARRIGAGLAALALVSALFGAFWLNGSGPP